MNGYLIIAYDGDAIPYCFTCSDYLGPKESTILSFNYTPSLNSKITGIITSNLAPKGLDIFQGIKQGDSISSAINKVGGFKNKHSLWESHVDGYTITWWEDSLDGTILMVQVIGPI